MPHAGFATTKRERELLLRAQRNAVDSASSNMAVKDTQPLLSAQQLQQQQQFLQMQQMARANANGV